MKKLLLALAFLCLATPAWAQCNGLFPQNTYCGNLDATPKPPHPVTLTLPGITVSCSGTNDTSAFNNAMTNAAAAGVALHITGGTTCAVAAASPPANLTIYGDGPNSVLKRIANSAAFTGVLSISNNNVTIRDLKVDGNKANQTNSASNIFFSGGAGTFLNIQSVNAKGASGAGLQIQGTADDTNKTETQVIGYTASGNEGPADIYIDGAKNLLLDQLVLRSKAGITTNGSNLTANVNQNIVVKNFDIDCQSAGTGAGISFTGLFSPRTASAGQNTINVGGGIVRNCGQNYAVVMQTRQGTLNNVQIIGSTTTAAPLLCNSFSTVISNNIIDFNSGQPKQDGMDCGGSGNIVITNNYVGPVVAGATPNGGNAISCGACGRPLISNNSVVIGDGSTGTGIGGQGYDSGGFAFILGAEASVTGNNIDCVATTSCTGISFSQGFNGGIVSGNNVNGQGSAFQAYVAAAPGFRFIGNKIAGLQICSVNSQSTTVIPLGCDVVEVGGTTTINAIQTQDQNTYLGAVPWINITNGGSGYVSAPTIAFSGGGCGVQPTGHTLLDDNGHVTLALVDTAGSGCTSAPAITPSGGGGGVGFAATSQFQLPNQINGNSVKFLFDGALTVTHNSGASVGNIITRSGSNITTSAGKVYEFLNTTGSWTQPQ